MDLGEGLAEGTVVDLVGEDMEEMEGSWPPSECPLPLKCRREDRSVGEREGKVYYVCVCVCVCVCVRVCGVGIGFRVSFLLMRL